MLDRVLLVVVLVEGLVVLVLDRTDLVGCVVVLVVRVVVLVPLLFLTERVVVLRVVLYEFLEEFALCVAVERVLDTVSKALRLDKLPDL